MLKLRLKEAIKSNAVYQLSETDMNPDLLVCQPICIPLHYATLPLHCHFLGSIIVYYHKE